MAGAGGRLLGLLPALSFPSSRPLLLLLLLSLPPPPCDFGEEEDPKDVRTEESRSNSMFPPIKSKE